MSKNIRPIVRLFDMATDETVDREMNDAEFAEWQANQVFIATQETEAQAKATAKTDLLAKLGITAEEAALLLS